MTALDTTTSAPVVGGGATRTWRLSLLSFDKPPLTLNQRLHWSHRAKITTQIHDELGPQIHSHEIPPLTFPTLTLHYVPRDRRGRDVDNLVPTSKACCDALKVHGVITDDTHLDVDHRMPVIHAADKNANPRLWFEVTSRG